MSWDYATFDDSQSFWHVRFSNGQPDWNSINGKRLSRSREGEILARIEADGWEPVATTRVTGWSLRIIGTATRGFIYRYKRQAPDAPYLYREVVCREPGQALKFHPGNAAETQATMDKLIPVVEACLRPYLWEGWEKDPCPSAIDPQLSTRPWGTWKVKAVKVRLRRPIDGSRLGRGDDRR